MDRRRLQPPRLAAFFRWRVLAGDFPPDKRLRQNYFGFRPTSTVPFTYSSAANDDGSLGSLPKFYHDASAQPLLACLHYGTLFGRRCFDHAEAADNASLWSSHNAKYRWRAPTPANDDGL